MSSDYEDYDAPAYDYGMAAVPGIEDLRFRGPVPDLDAPYLAGIGGAQTFGRFVTDPFLAVLGQRLGLPCLNLGLGGAGPEFAHKPAVLPLLQRAALVVVQCFSGRSASNSLFDNTLHGRNSGVLLANGKPTSFETFFDELCRRGERDRIERVVTETREDFTFKMRELGRALEGRGILLWIARRAPDYETDWSSPFGMMNYYPQFIDRNVIEAIRPCFDEYVEYTATTGLPQRLWPAALLAQLRVHRLVPAAK